MNDHVVLSKPPVLEGYLFNYKDAIKARDTGKLLSLRIETSLICNLRCKYCYRDSGDPGKNEMNYNELTNIIKQAYELGAKSIVVIGGGEPTIYKNFRKLIGFIDNYNMIPVIITNGQVISKDLADFLYGKNASILIKLDSLKEEVQDKLSNTKGSYKNIQSALSNLFDVGFMSGDKVRIGASFVTNKLNYNEVEDIWRFCRDRNIFPNMETLSPNGRAKKHPELMLDLKEYQTIKFKLLDIDRKEYGYDWNPYTPIVGAGCRQLEYSLCVTVEGYVRPCAAIIINNLSVRPNYRNSLTLKEVLKDPFIHKARNAEKYLKGKCSICNYRNNDCIGCRGSAYIYGRLAGLDPLSAVVSEDPFCSRRICSNIKLSGNL